MTAIAENKPPVRREANRAFYPVAASTTIYEGTLVYLNASGYAVADDGAGLQQFAGVAIEAANNGSGSAGDKNVEVWLTGVFPMVSSGQNQASVGLPVFGIDNQTVQLANTLASYVGIVDEYISATSIMVRINAARPVMRAPQAVNNVHNTNPTIAELTVSFGAPASLGRGFIGTVDDNDGDAISYIVWTTDAGFYYVIGTKAA